MMTYQQDPRAAKAYRENAVLSASPEQLVVLLYEHLIINLKRAAKQIEKNDLQAKSESLNKANDIVLELLSSLDFDKGGDIASRLASLYGFFSQEIATVSRTLDTARIAQLVEMAEELHESWAQAAQAAEGQAGAQGGAPA